MINEQDPKALGAELAAINKGMAEVQGKIAAATASFQTELKRYQEKDAELRTAIKQAMSDNGVKKYEDDNITITYIAPTTRKGFDAKAMALAHPKIYKKFEKITNVSDSVRITVKGV